MEPESTLVEAARKGSEEAFRELLRLHQSRVRAYLSRFVRDRDARDDIAQDTFLAAYQSLASYSADAPFGLWLLRIAKHRALRYLERFRGDRSFQAILSRSLAEELRREGEDVSARDHEVAALKSCIEQLPEHGNLLISEYYLKRKPAVAIAEETGRKKSAVWMTLLRLRQALRQCVKMKLSTAEIM